jgi:hypothetical protein
VTGFDLFVGAEQTDGSNVLATTTLDDDGIFRDASAVHHWTGTTGVQERLEGKFTFYCHSLELAALGQVWS